MNARITYHDKVEFIPGKQGWLNNGKSVNVTHHINMINKIQKKHLAKFTMKLSINEEQRRTSST